MANSLFQASGEFFKGKGFVYLGLSSLGLLFREILLNAFFNQTIPAENSVIIISSVKTGSILTNNQIQQISYGSVTFNRVTKRFVIKHSIVVLSS